MKSTLLLISTVLFLLCSNITFAGEEESTLLIQNFLAALRSDNQAIIALSWKELNKDPEAMVYMEQNNPWAASAHRLIGVSLKAAGYIEEYRKYYATLPSPQMTLPVAPDRAILLTNTDATLIYPNQDQPSNQQVVRQGANATLMDNKTQTYNHPNQNEIPNQEKIRNRVERLSSTGQ